MTDDLLDRLAREAIDETRNLAAAEGWFSPQTDVTIDRGTTPPTVTLKVVTGEPTRIASVKIDVTGPAKTDVPQGTDTIARVEREWGLPVGAVFRQAAWSAAKDQAVATLTATPYAAAKIVQQRSAHRSRALRRGPGRRARERSRVPLRTARDHRLVPLPRLARPQLQHGARGRSLRRAGAPALRPPAERIGLFRERAGVDRSGRRARRRRDSQGRRDRGAGEAPRRRPRLLDRRRVPRQRVVPRRQPRRPRDADAGRGPARVEAAIGVGALHATAERSAVDRHLDRGRRAHRHRGAHHAHGGRRHPLAHGRGAQRARAVRDVLFGRAATRRRRVDPLACGLRRGRAVLAAHR